MDRPSRRAIALLLGAALALSSVVAPAGAQDDTTESPGATLVELCEDLALGDRTCTGFDSGSVVFAGVCAQLPLPAEACANVTDGRVIDPTLIDEYEGTWVARALRLQSRLDDGEPLRNVLLPHTHNSSNSTSYSPRLANIDPNQRYTIGDQMRMGIRGIELDLHWVPHPTGSAATGGRAVALCHGRSEQVGTLTIHLGCTVDRLMAEGVAEVRDFLRAPGNEREVVVLYLENQMEGDATAHEQAASVLESVLGDLVLRPPAGEPCAPMPLDLSRSDIRAMGARVVIVGDCGPGAWGTWVHERGPDWDERGVGEGYPPFPECLAERAERDYDGKWIRVFEDSTWLSAMVSGPSPGITPATTTAMVRCGVDMIGFDRLEPFDGRLEALVWSWAPDEPADDPALHCAAWRTDARFQAASCAGVRAYACQSDDGRWIVPPDRGPWRDGFRACEAIGARFAVPPTGWQNERLRSAAPPDSELWLNYQSIATMNEWKPGAATPPAVAPAMAQPPTAPPSTQRLPATGGSPPVQTAVLLALAGLGLLRRGSRRTSRAA